LAIVAGVLGKHTKTSLGNIKIINMGLTFRLGQVPLAIFTDTSNNVGIGAAANASFKLQVTGATNLTGALTGTSATFTGSGAFGSAAMSTARLTITDGTSIAAYWKATNTNVATRDWTIITNNNNFGDFAIRQGNSQGADATTGTDRLFISNNGLIGIGYSNPQAFLDSSGYGNLVVGNGSGAKGITIFGGTTGQSGLMFADATSGSGAYTGYILYSHSSDQMELATGGGTPRLTISSTGAATFSSTITAASTLYLGYDGTYGSTYRTLGLTGITNGTHRIFAGTADNLYIAAATSRGIEFWTDGSSGTKMIITSGGNVGIGTSSPTASLHIIRALGSDVISIGESGNNTRFAIGQEASYTGNYINSTNIDLKIQSYLSGGSGGSIIFQTGGSGSGSLEERIRITSNGNINMNAAVYNNTAVATTRILYIGSDYRIGGISSIRASKKNIQNLSNVDWIYSLNPVTFNYRKKDEEEKYTDEVYDELVYGLIAEDTAPIADFLINYNAKQDGTKEMVGIEYMRLITPMLKAIQELKSEIEQLKNK
jgi:hypothetical protein